MLAELALNKRCLFFGGKGGVGKTSLAAATALLAARHQRRTLLISTDPAHNLGYLFEKPIGASITPLQPNLDALELDPSHTVEQHLQSVTAVLQRLMPSHLNGEIDKHIALSRQAPGMEEAALLERMAELIIQPHDYDLLIFDTAPSGHTARLLALPEILSAWTDGLLQRRDKADKLSAKLTALINRQDDVPPALNNTPADGSREAQIRHILNRRKTKFAQLREALTSNDCGFVIALTPERLPVMESIALYQQLTTNGINVAGLVVNKRIPADAGAFFTAHRRQETENLGTLAAALPAVPRQDLWLMPQEIVGLAALEQLAEQCST